MRHALLVLALATLTLSGCASSLSGSAYTRGQARTLQNVEMGVVEHVRVVQIEGTKTGIGSTTGAVIGSTASTNYKDKPLRRTVKSVTGAIVGGVVGAATEEAVTRQKGFEITVRLDSGRMVAIVQAADEDFKVGQRVRLVHGGQGATRVTH
jgi:outer membrane lipoprotein SlyB